MKPIMASARPFLPSPKAARSTFDLEHTRRLVDEAFGADLHALRVVSLANGVAGVLNTAVLSIHAIGRAYAELAHTTPKSGVKQVDRMLGNDGIDLDGVLRSWVRFVIGTHPSVIIAMDWTDFEADDHTTLCAYLITTHGRAMPLAWKTVKKSKLKDRQTALECEMVERLGSWLPASVRITLLADRGFGKKEFYRVLELLGWDFVVRFRSDILVEHGGQTRPAADWVPSNGHSKALVGALVTADKAQVGAVVLVKAKRMQDSWCLATSLAESKAADIVKLYSRRFTIEEVFRDTKDLHFGLGLSATHIRDERRRDRLLLLVAIGHTLLTLLGAASEESGLDRYLKTNTVKTRTMSLFNQGAYWYRCLPTMRDEWFERLINAYDRIVRNHEFFSQFFAQQGPVDQVAR
jgi:hypothetical protein